MPGRAPRERRTMPELRRGPIRNQWVIIAPERAKRPSDYEARGTELGEQASATCPFCSGNEAMTPPEIQRTADADGRWRVRVVPNKFPALHDYDELGREGIEGIFDRMNGEGAHEVVIETPEHSKELPDLPVAHVKQIIDMYIARLADLMRNPWLRYILLFKNHGKEAGASLLHPHSQIIATPIVPREVRDVLRVAKDYYEHKERCLFCDVMLGEIRSGERIIDEIDGYVTWAPYDSRFPFEVLIYTRAHCPDFTRLDDEQRWGLARTLKRTLQRLRSLLGDIPYNFILQTSPNPVQRPGKPGYWKTLEYDYHWRIEVLPRLTRVAGFEWGTGFYINPMPPERAAGYLREASVPELD